MDAPRLLVLIFILLILFASPDTQTPSPSQQHELDHLIRQERHALAVLANAQYGEFDAVENRWINVTGLRQRDGYAWSLLPKVQERARQQASIINESWLRAKQDEDFTSEAVISEPTNATSSKPSAVQSVPLYQNVTGIVRGHWVKSKLAKEIRAPTVNLSALVPKVNYMTHKYTRNITGSEGDIRIDFDEKRSESIDLEGVIARGITADLMVNDAALGGDGWDMTLHGIHFPRDGSIVLTTTGARFAGVFALPHLMLSEKTFASARHLLNKTLEAAIRTQERASETNALSPWSSSPQSTSDLSFRTPHCEYIVYLHQHPHGVPSMDVGSVESELRDPTGRLDLSYPPMKMSSVIFSPDCGFILESKGPPDFAPQYGQHLQGPKMEVYIESGKRVILAFAVVICAELFLLLRQMREASTPSIRSRISFYTISMMSMGDGLVCMAFLVISIILDAVALPLVATAFLAFLSVSFFGMKFSMDIWTVQASERDEQRSQQERRNASVNNAAAVTVPAQDVTITPADADTLPLPVTAARPAPSTPAPRVEQQTQALPGDDRTAGDNAQTTAVNTARRELSTLYSRFYFSLVVLLFLTLYSSTWPSLPRTIYNRLLSIIYLSFYTPQIYRNVMRNCRKALQWRFVVGQSVLRMLPMAYVYLYQDNVLFVKKDTNWMLGLFGWSWFQVWILISQELFGPRFLVPRACHKWIPAVYDYHPILREEDEETGASFPIGFTQAQSSSRSSSSNNITLEPKKGEDIGKMKKSFDCAICMQTLEVTVVPRDAKGGNTGAVGVKDLVFGRRTYMVTPCRHIFHSICLEGWMRYRLQCPICRDNLPPL
ncbi:MAG: hypothetical protein Q9219_005831 [cf. Caloplaca sp. 3 TL-2023]